MPSAPCASSRARSSLLVTRENSSISSASPATSPIALSAVLSLVMRELAFMSVPIRRSLTRNIAQPTPRLSQPRPDPSKRTDQRTDSEDYLRDLLGCSLVDRPQRDSVYHAAHDCRHCHHAGGD